MKKLNMLLSIILIMTLVAVTAGCSSEEKKSEETTDGAQKVESGEATEAKDKETEEATETDADPVVEAIKALNLDYSKGLEDNGYMTGITANDYVDLPDYKNMEIPEEVLDVDDALVDAQVAQILNNFTTKEEVMDRAIEDGDTVNIDYVGSVDGVEFAGGSTGGQGTEVTIGVTSYIDDFLEQLIGHKPGESFDIEVTFPDVYQNKDLEGKDAVFAITVNHIVNNVVPELTDDFVSENFQESLGWSTVEELKNDLMGEFQKNAKVGYIQKTLFNFDLVKEIPKEAMEFQTALMINNYKQSAVAQGVELEELIKNNTEFTSEEELIEGFKEEIENAAKGGLIVQALAEDGQIEVDETMIKEFFLLSTGSEDFSQVEEVYGLPFLKYSIIQEKVFEYLMESNDIQWEQ